MTRQGGSKTLLTLNICLQRMNSPVFESLSAQQGQFQQCRGKRHFIVFLMTVHSSARLLNFHKWIRPDCSVVDRNVTKRDLSLFCRSVLISSCPYPILMSKNSSSLLLPFPLCAPNLLEGKGIVILVSVRTID